MLVPFVLFIFSFEKQNFVNYLHFLLLLLFLLGLTPFFNSISVMYGGQLPIQCSWISNQYKPCSSQVTDNFST